MFSVGVVLAALGTASVNSALADSKDLSFTARTESLDYTHSSHMSHIPDLFWDRKMLPATWKDSAWEPPNHDTFHTPFIIGKELGIDPNLLNTWAVNINGTEKRLSILTESHWDSIIDRYNTNEKKLGEDIMNGNFKVGTWVSNADNRTHSSTDTGSTNHTLQKRMLFSEIQTLIRTAISLARRATSIGIYDGLQR